MNAPNDRPWQRDYTIRQTLVIAETPELRVIDQTLAPGERVPWHLHPDNDDLFICLRGTFEIHEINPERKTVLKALDRHVVPKREPHMVVNLSSEECQLLTIQGPGKYDFRRLKKLDWAKKPRDVFILFQAGNLKKARAFGASADLRKAMKAAGVRGKPEMWFLK